jgi:hypothetical protein
MMISSDWRYDLIVHDTTGKASLPVSFFGIWLFHSHYNELRFVIKNF